MGDAFADHEGVRNSGKLMMLGGRERSVKRQSVVVCRSVFFRRRLDIKKIVNGEGLNFRHTFQLAILNGVRAVRTGCPAFPRKATRRTTSRPKRVRVFNHKSVLIKLLWPHRR